MGTWFKQASEIQELREQNRRQARIITMLRERLKFAGIDIDHEMVDGQVRELALSGQTIQAIKLYRDRTGADLLTAKRAIDALQPTNAPMPQSSTVNSGPYSTSEAEAGAASNTASDVRTEDDEAPLSSTSQSPSITSSGQLPF